MFTDLINYPIKSPKLNWEARQVLRDIHNEPHLFLRIKITGTYFPQRAVEPYVSVGKRRSRFVEISEDGSSAKAYFDRPIPKTGDIIFGYGAHAMLRIPRKNQQGKYHILERAKLPAKTHLLQHFF